MPGGHSDSPHGCGAGRPGSEGAGPVRVPTIGTLIGSMKVAHAGTQSLAFELDAFRARFEREFGESLE